MVVGTPQGGSIAKAWLIRLGTFTHSADFDQRAIELTVTGTVVGGITLSRIPIDASIAVPGYYHLFLVRTSGAVSVGAPIRIPV
jgi:galactose oxidase